MKGTWSGQRGRVSALMTAALGAFLFVGVEAATAQQGAITGTITDAETLSPVSGAQVFVSGTVIGTLSGAQGTYRLEGVPVGQATITVRLIGYKELSQTVTVQAGQVATADFAVEQTALRLQDIVVTGVVGETPQVKLPFTVERLDSQDIPVPAADASSLLAGKAAGVRSISGSGQPGQASDITLRGPTSINASGRSQSPLIVIDGVIQSESATLADVGALDIDHVEIVKGAAAASLYGSRAQNGVIQITTKRGTDLQTNSFDLMLRGEYGFGQLAGEIGLTTTHPYVMNGDGTKFVDTDGNEVDFGDLGRPGFGSPILADGGTPETTFNDNPFPNELFDHIDTFFSPGQTYDVYGAVTGRFGESSFRVSVDQFRETGVVSCSQCEDNLNALNAERIGQGLSPFNVRTPKDDGFERQNARLNVDTRFGDLDLAASGFYSRSVQDDAAVTNGSFFELTFMSPALDLTEIDPSDGYPIIDVDPLSLQQNPLYNLATATEQDTRTRTMGSVDLNWAPAGIDWLSFEANASYDRTQFSDFGIRPKNEKTTSAGVNEFTGGSLRLGAFTDEAVNASATVSFNQTLMDGDMTVRAKARYLVENQDFATNGAFGQRFSVADVPNFAAIEGDQSANNSSREIRAEGYFGIASVDYKGRYILDGLVRRDGSSLFGPEERWHTYFRGSAAWRPSQEDWWNVDPIDELKLRFSYGTAGGRPNFFAQYETFGVQAGAIFPINLGNRALKPEFTKEREAGLNFVLFDNVGVDYTYAWAVTDDQLLLVPQPAFVGFQSQWQNAGEIASRTHEVSVRWAAVDNSTTGLQFRLNWDQTRQEITRLDVPDFTQAGNFFVYDGAPLGEMWGDRWATSCADLATVGIGASECASNFQVNDDGLLVATGAGNAFTDGIAQGLWGTDVTVNTETGTASYDWGMPIKAQDYSPACVNKNPTDFETACQLQEFLPFGNTTPDWNASFATNVRYKGLTANVLLDGSIGHSIYNGTRQWALRELRGEDVDQAGKSEGFKKPIGYVSELYDVNSNNSFFRENGDWVKLREVALGYTLPQSVMQDVFKGKLDRITLNLIGRNLLTFTDYRGYDPEVGNAGGAIGSTAINAVDNFGYPNFRTYTLSAEIIF